MPSRKRALLAELGRIDYAESLVLQQRLHTRRRAGEIPDVVLIVEHEPIFTIGRSGSRDHLLVPSEVLVREGINVHKVDRGGDITYHGPGQLVAYPIVDLRAYGKDIKGYIRRLETAAINTLEGFGIDAARSPGYPGVWASGRKIASIGVCVRGWVTRHGLALNVDVNPAHFGMIRPCGLEVKAVSMVECAGAGAGALTMKRVQKEFVRQMESAFGWSFERVGLDALAGGEHGTPAGVAEGSCADGG